VRAIKGRDIQLTTDSAKTIGNPNHHGPIKSRDKCCSQTTRNDEYSDGSPDYTCSNANHLNLTMGESNMIKASGHHEQDKWVAWEERLRAVEGFNVYDLIKAVVICLVPNVVVPKKFRVPDFIKYTRLKCPNTPIRSYSNKMAEVVHDDKLLIQFFQDSFTGSGICIHEF
jgi:hypothetical protein